MCENIYFINFISYKIYEYVTRDISYSLFFYVDALGEV